jgi:hypothetical protein
VEVEEEGDLFGDLCLEVEDSKIKRAEKLNLEMYG